MIDAAVRAKPEAAYDYAELFSGVAAPAAETPEPSLSGVYGQSFGSYVPETLPVDGYGG